MLLNLIKKSFKQVIGYNSIVLFLVAYLIITSLIAPLVKTAFLFVSLGTCIILLTAVYFSGWFQLINTVSMSNNEELKNKNMFSIFFEGAGKNFVSVLIALAFYIAAALLVLYCTGMVANHFFGDINTVLSDIFAASSENNNPVELISSLPAEKQYALYGWQFCIVIASCIFGFIFMMYCPFLINSKNNMLLRPFSAFVDSIKFLFKNFFPLLGLYILIYIVYVILSLLRAVTDSNMILSLLLLFVYIYYLAFVVMIIFNYHEAKNNSIDGCDRIGQDESCNKISENN